MKQTLIACLGAAALFLVSCETTREITIAPNGSGTIQTTTDMGGLIGIAKMSGQDKEMEKMERAIDTSFNLGAMADSIPDLSASEKALVKKGTLGLKMNMEEDLFLIKMDFPFSKTEDIQTLDKLSGKMMSQAMKKQMAAGAEEGAPDMMPPDAGEASPDDYFITTYSKGLIERKLDADKYAGVAENEMLQSMKEMANMGIGNTTLIFNLPAPAKKTSGTNLTLSADKKKVTVVSSLEDFFDDAKKMEFRIEY